MWWVPRNVSSSENEGRVAQHGWGARLLARQDPEGTWAGGLSSDGGLYSPKWISTTYTMLMLRDFGLPPNNRQGKTYFELERLGAPSRWNTLRALRILKWWDSGSVTRGS
jgi:hypothetical protein